MKKLVSVMGIMAALGLAGCGEKAPVAENGDTVVINFAGFLDGVQFPGGTAENFPLNWAVVNSSQGLKNSLLAWPRAKNVILTSHSQNNM